MNPKTIKDKLKTLPVIGPTLQRGYYRLVESRQQITEDLRGIKGRVYDSLKIEHRTPLTIQQQWARVRSRSAPLEELCRSDRDASVLFMTIWGCLAPVFTGLESVLAMSLNLRGARTHSLMCNGALPACTIDPLGNHGLPVPEHLARAGLTPVRCRSCARWIRGCYHGTPTSVLGLDRYLHADDLRRILGLVEQVPTDRLQEHLYRDIKVGEHAFSSVLRWLGRGTLLDDPYHHFLLRRHLISSMLLADLTERALKDLRPTRMMAVHGIYVDHGTACEVARKLGVPVVVFAVPYRRDTIMLCHGDTYHRALVLEPNANWEHLELTATQEERLLDYVDSRRSGKQDSVTYHPSPIEAEAAIRQDLGLSSDRPIVSLFTNVMWDAQLYHSYNAFQNLLDWLFQTMEYFERRPDLQLVIRIHPAEVKAVKKSTQPLAEEIRQRFPRLADNIKVISPESDLSSYTLAEMSQATLIYGTKMGLEIALRGVPVIIAGESMNRGKGFTYDVETPQQYFELLDRVTELPRNTPEMMKRARAYAHHFYFRRQIDFPYLKGYVPGRPHEIQLSIKSVEELLPGRNPYLDTICEGIITGSEFVVD